ncbi:hypothetical protein DBA20_02860 [Pandoraea capi]|nr:hypothetical protein [Pandoraea sp. LA3]MDN4581928.1 hypothetical protein [Pandoraea capi]
MSGGLRDVAGCGVGRGPIYVVDTTLLDEVIRARMSPVGEGAPVQGIPGTAPRADKRAISLMNTQTGQIVSVGDPHHRFSQQSMSKPMAMALAIRLMGDQPEHYRQHIASEPSELPYNDPALMPDGRPFNSSVNIGALATWMLIHIHTPSGKEPFDLYLELMRELTGNTCLTVNEEMALGEFRYCPPGAERSRNRLLLAKLTDVGFVDDDSLLRYALRKHGGGTIKAHTTRDGTLAPSFVVACRHALSEDALLSYCRACAVMVNTEDMVRVAGVFRNEGVWVDGVDGARKQVLPAAIADYVRHSNDMGGSYEESGTQYAKNAFGGKTGVDGGIFGSLYRHANLVIATHHSDLNAAGNSGEGQKWINALNRLSLTFPSSPGTAKAGSLPLTRVRSIATRMPIGALGLSPRDVDRRLQMDMTDETRRSLMDAMPLIDGAPQQFYAKAPDGRKSKDQTFGGTLLVSAADIHGTMKRYYHMSKDRHALGKVVVVDEAHQQEAPWKRALSGRYRTPDRKNGPGGSTDG